MAETGELRIVLQTGASAGLPRIFAVAFTFGSIAASLLLGILACGGALPAPHRYVMPLAPVGFVVVSVVSHWMIWRNRATDMLVGPDGLRVEGGPAAGDRARWEEIDHEKCRIEEDTSVSVTVNGEKTFAQKLYLARRGEAIVLASSTDQDEQRSLAAVLETLKSRHGVVADAGPADVVRCASCGYTAAPADLEHVTCWQCGSAVRMPAALRGRLRESDQVARLRTTTERRIQGLIDQPRALVANAWLLASLVVWYVVPVLMCLTPTAWATWPLLAFGLLSMSNLQVARRHAFHRLTMVFAARPAEHPGSPLRCRSCAGPLPAGTTVLTRCPWCAADNIRQLVFERPASAWASVDQDIETFASDQRDRASWPRFAVFGSLVGAVGFAVWSRFG